MGKTSDERVLLDTNVLLDATNSSRRRHRKALSLLRRTRRPVITAQIVREYIAVVTRPVEANGLGMSIDDGLANLRAFRRIARLLPEEKPVLPRFLELVERVPCRGRSIHDAYLVATMQVHAVRRIATSNPGHFTRFSGLVKVIEIR